MKTRTLFAIAAMITAFMIPSLSYAGDHTIKAGARAFETEVTYAAVGDHVGFANMNSHNSVSVDGMIPEGATPWAGKLGENIALTMEVPGIYSYVCQPHIGFGMAGIIVVGDVTADDIAAYKQKAMDTLQGPFRRLIGKINKIKPTK